MTDSDDDFNPEDSWPVSEPDPDNIIIKFGNNDESRILLPVSNTKEVTSPAKLGFIGAGNMAQALVKAFLKRGK